MSGTLRALDSVTAVVTGGRSGIGAACVRALRASGASVASLDLSPPSGLDDEGVLELEVDVVDTAAVATALDAVAAWRAPIRALVQCAGITRDGVLWKLEDDDWESVIDVNLSGTFRVLRGVVPMMRAAGGGAVVNVASINGMRGKFGQANYAASKAGVIALTKTAARELGAFGIRVNAVAPGMVRTPMTESLPDAVRARAVEESALGRACEPEEIADVAVFLLSEGARGITGQTLRVDAGQMM